MRHPATSIVLALSFIVHPWTTLAKDANGLKIEVTRPVECSRKTQNGDSVQMQYKGTLTDGTVFDSSYQRNQPFEFDLGMGQVISGWDQGLLGMCIGEARKLTIPPELAYGDRAIGTIPAGSTLIFETELVAIAGVESEDLSNTPNTTDMPSSAALGSNPTSKVITATGKTTAQDAPGSEDGECRLLGPFALIVQGGLGLLALSSLVWKRWRERPRRPLKIWFFDASKQVFGSVLLHGANLLMSIIPAENQAKPLLRTDLVHLELSPSDGRTPNPCSFYLINLAIDTTIGIPILVVLLRFLHYAFLITPLARPPQSLKSGNYGQPPRVTWWLKQSIVYFIGLLLMKLCVLVILEFLPWIAWVGDWALRWTEGNEAVQITFVMFIFPLVMNGLQYYIIDSFIKDPASGHEAIPTDADDDDEDQDILRDDDDDDDGSDGNMTSGVDVDSKGERKVPSVGTTKIATLTIKPAETDEDLDDSKDGESSSSNAKRT